MNPSENVAAGRTRARGRARGQRQSEPARRPIDVPTAIVARPEPPQPVTVPTPHVQTPGPSGIGRAMQRGGLTKSDESSLSAGVQGMVLSEGVGRGSFRGRRAAMEPMNLRPPTCDNKKGVAGEKITVLTNYVTVESSRGPDFIFYQYRVEFSPTVESPKMRRAMLFDHVEVIGRSFVFDGMEDLKTTNRLATDVYEGTSVRRTDNQPVLIRIKLTGELNAKHPEVLRLLNTQQRKNFLHMNFSEIGRHFFDAQAKIPVERYKLELWPGVITAIRMHEQSLLMVIDNIHKVLRCETILDQMKHFFEEDPRNWQARCQRELVNSIVMTNYNNKTYTLDDFDFTKTPRDTFEMRAGVMSYVDYYKNQYNIEIRDLKQPLIICRPKERDIRSGRRDVVYLIPELSVMTGLTDTMRTDFNIMRELANTTRPDPNSRVEQIRRFIQRCNSNTQARADMAQWGIKYGSDLLQIEARQLPGERVIQINGEDGLGFKNGDFTQVMRERTLFEPQAMTNFHIIHSARDQQNAQDLYKTFCTVCQPMRMQVAQPIFKIVDDRNVTSFVDACKMAKQSGANLVVVIVPNNRKDRYDAIKKICCIDHPISSQVVVSRTLSKRHMLKSVATKIAIQINSKLGGAPWKIQIPFKPGVRFMICGFDTYHDSFQKGRSVGALVSTMNVHCTQWSSRISFHAQREELSDQLYTNFCILLKKFATKNGAVPDIVLFYRDGVSDGQIGYVQELEVQQILRAYESIAGTGKELRLCFVVANKRISTRFFKPLEGGGYQNPLPGTIIDDTITRPERYDFYLIAQSVRQGTVSPTQFNVIYDTAGLKPNQIQILTYKLCHMYYNWQGTIRVPAPCQYAHKLAFLVGQSLHREPAESLMDQLFYL